MSNISENSKRIARNTFLLYFRMLLMMFIGLFTSRIVLQKLGIDDYGVWNAVGGIVMMFSMVTDCVSSAIHRFLAFELGTGDSLRLKKAFSSGVYVQFVLILLLVVLVGGLGYWFLENKMVIPDGRMDAARTVLYVSMGILSLSILSVPFNASIVAHEKMSAFALLSIVEAALKLVVALVISISPYDKLKTYAFLMLAVALIVRASYILYCRRHFEETRGALVYDRESLREMSGFAGWSFIGSGANALNTHGINLLTNVFFGVVLNAARGVAAQVENVVRQFVNNFLTALNPQITKSWAAGEKHYCFELVLKGVKFSYLVILLFLLPLLFEAQGILKLWLVDVPGYSADFVRLALAVLLIDMSGNSLMILQLATGKVKSYYIVTGLSSLLCLPAVWLAFRLGAGPRWAYIILIAFYLIIYLAKVAIVHKSTGLPVGKLVKKVIFPLCAVTVLSLILPALVAMNMSEGLGRVLLVCLAAWLSTAVSTYFLALTRGEKDFLLSKIAKLLHTK